MSLNHVVNNKDLINKNDIDNTLSVKRCRNVNLNKCNCL